MTQQTQTSSAIKTLFIAAAFLAGGVLSSDCPDQLTVERTEYLLTRDTYTHIFKAKVEDKIGCDSNACYYLAELRGKPYKGCVPEWEDGEEEDTIVIEHPIDEEESADRPIPVGDTYYFFANDEPRGVDVYGVRYCDHNGNTADAEDGVEERLEKYREENKPCE